MRWFDRNHTPWNKTMA